MQLRQSTPRQLRASLALAASLLLGTQLCACGAGSKPADTSPDRLPAPSVLAPASGPRRASYTEADLTKTGSAFDSNLPFNLAAPNGSLCDFDPDYAAGADIAGAAYCIYNFDLAGYDRNAQIQHSWSNAPGSGKLWLGLADWSGDSWEWYGADSQAPLNLASLTPYIRGDGKLLLCVMVLGTAARTLDSLRIGSQPPVASLVLTPASGMVPLLVEADASASSDPDSSIVNYEWDLDGNGSYEVSGTEATKSIALNSPSAVAVSLRVTDNNGIQKSKTATARAFTEWKHSWGGGGSDYIQACAYDGAEAIYCAGLCSSFGAGGSDVLLLKYGLDGSLVWARTWGTPQSDSACGIAIDAEGNLLVGGTTYHNAGNFLLARFSPEGEALWTKAYDFSPYNQYATGFQVLGSRAYICGYGDGSALPGSFDEGELLCCNLEGAPLWGRAWSEILHDCSLQALQAKSTLLGSSSVYMAGGSGDDMLYLRSDEDGDLTANYFWNSGGTDSAYDILVTGLTLHEVYLAGTAAVSGQPGTRGAALVQFSLGSPLEKIWYATENDVALSLAAVTDGILLSGYTGSGFPTGGLLLGYNDGGALYYAEALQKGDSNYSFGGGLENLAGAALLAAGSCGKTSGSTWAPRSGISTAPSYIWQEASGSWDARAVVVANISGVESEPASAVENSGGGGMNDCLICVKALP